MASINQADEDPKREKTILETVQMIWYPFVISLLDSGNRRKEIFFSTQLGKL